MPSTFKVVKYEPQKNENAAIRAGLWAIVETKERDVAYASSEHQALELKARFERFEKT